MKLPWETLPWYDQLYYTFVQASNEPSGTWMGM